VNWSELIFRDHCCKIFDREIWPRVMATIAAGNKSKPKIPVIKLPMAFPLVSPVSIGNAAGAAVGLDSAVVGAHRKSRITYFCGWFASMCNNSYRHL